MITTIVLLSNERANRQLSITTIAVVDKKILKLLETLLTKNVNIFGVEMRRFTSFQHFNQLCQQMGETLKAPVYILLIPFKNSFILLINTKIS